MALAYQRVASWGTDFITTPEAYGWTAGNTTTQNTAAFQAAIQAASDYAPPGGQGIVELVQAKTYTVTGVSGSSQCLRLGILQSGEAHNVWIRTRGSS